MGERDQQIRAREALLLARDLIDYGWSRDHSAQDQNGRPVSPKDSSAVRFDLLGALEAVRIPSLRHRLLVRQLANTACRRTERLAILRNQEGDGWVLTEFNSFATLTEVLSLYDETLSGYDRRLERMGISLDKLNEYP